MADPHDYTKKDSATETGASKSTQGQAWHEARNAFVSNYGDGTRSSLDAEKNVGGYDHAFGEVGSDKIDRS
jgi:hypothetical protein